jgi:hypothetical protein
VILENPWEHEFLKWVKATKKELFILTPFFDKYALDQILKEAHPTVKLRFILGFSGKSLEETSAESKTCEVIRMMIERENRIEAKQLVGLHAKIYLFDGKMGVVTSANLTKAGLEKNIEYGVFFTGREAQTLHSIAMKCWNHRKSVRLDEEWLTKHGHALTVIDNRQMMRNSEERGNQSINVGGSRADPREIRGNTLEHGHKLALLLPANIKKGGKKRLGEIMEKRGRGQWETGRKIDSKTLSPKGAHIYFYATWKKEVRHVATIQKIESSEGGTLLSIFGLRELESSRSLNSFTKRDGQNVRGLRGHAYVYDPEA